ncbi:uncharacterized protein PHACADRAFT_149253 [Phanerochaete carnosa HHB-10118-sp]|uniref:Uncharacterized protein n=1 Tax=Phanerochaete carnosa (strain HHB-10118-sp) TaxID=650164 RepID=K5VM57_PHACS|nr:uncharacterized protein PHACADRAFT_149253 [Phanerochaete carnosa HHB-10118-sp]EKM52528.1 hypothetical protein PHACADRAFT_149253 [Phanerochaete carnosa HHB-10118-sp]
MYEAQQETESTLCTRLPPVDEEDEAVSESEEFSAAESGDEGVYRNADSEQADTSFESSQSVGGSSRGKGKGVDRGEAQTPPFRARSSSMKGREKHSRSWADLDPTMVVALVSPIGNWLTGSDHVKNLLLLLLLIFYLHQLIEVPWKLYQGSRPRSRKSLKQVVQDARAEFASSELRVRELFFLSLTVIAPFIGAVLVRHIFSAMDGVGSLSWFSVTLFVLATGIRPWMHVVSRLQERTDELQQAIHAEEEEEYHHAITQKLDSVVNRLAALERALHEVQAKTDKIAPLEEMCDEMNETLETIERTVHRQERKTDSARVSHNSRLSALESAVLRLEERQRHQVRTVAAHTQAARNAVNVALPPSLSQFLVLLYSQLSRTIHNIIQQYPFLFLKQMYTKDIMTPVPTSPPISPSGTVHHFNGTPLETIPEAADSDSEGTYVSDKESASHSSPGAGETRKRGGRKLSRSRSRSYSGPRPPLRRRNTYGRMALDYAAALVSWPYQFAVKALLFIIPAPIQKHFL